MANQAGPIWNYSLSTGLAPNWYHYYTQVYPFDPTTGAPSATAPPDFSYTGLPANSTELTPTVNAQTQTKVYNIHFGDALYEQQQITDDLVRFPVFMVDKSNPNSLIKTAGYLSLRPGILSYLYIAAHERGHQFAFNSPTMTDKDANGVVQSTNYQVDNVGGVNYTEYDNLDKTWKLKHHMSNTTSDTTALSSAMDGLGDNGAYYPSGYSKSDPATDKPDNEVVADIQALAPMFDVGNTLWNQDWSDNGIQFYTSEVVPLSFLHPHPDPSGAPTLFYQFTPANGLPVSVFSIDDIQKYVPAGETVVRSLGDLG